ncbi:hypothetical protein BpHYR1_037021 [Brachionus plicatilis]|uniref:Uncharacterized protein n=1 Tax=Brachionus plicatilis TaxID=10195 RepID=A0A3M7SMM3_BRAPC|nr:hypothetical protein BpHYR1_037021 [Brachionus plicatilis]
MLLANPNEIPRWIFKNSIKQNLKKPDKPVSHKTLFSALDIALNQDENNAIKITGKCPGVKLKNYFGPNLNSASGKLSIFGMINVEKLVIDPLTPLENQEIKVAALNCKRDCLIGMDIIRKVPKLNDHFTKIKETINTFSRVNELETESSDVFLAQSTALMDDTSKNLESEILSELSKVAAESFMDLKQNNTQKQRLLNKR